MTVTHTPLQRLSVCGFTTMDTTFVQDVELARTFGLGAVGVCEAKLTDGVTDGVIDGVIDGVTDAALLAGAGLRAGSCVPANISPLPTRPAGLYPGPEDPDKRTELMIASLRRLAALGPEAVVFCTGSNAARDPRAAEDIAVEAFAAVAAVAVELGVRVCVEPLRDVGFDGSWLRSLPAALAFLERVGSDALAICFDVYHLWDSPDILHLVRRHGARIGSVQLSDWHEPPRARVDRLIPGDGVIDLSALIGALEEGGFTGSYDVEIFSDDGRWGTSVPGSVWAMPPDEVYRRVVAGFLQVWDQRH